MAKKIEGPTRLLPAQHVDSQRSRLSIIYERKKLAFGRNRDGRGFAVAEGTGEPEARLANSTFSSAVILPSVTFLPVNRPCRNLYSPFLRLVSCSSSPATTCGTMMLLGTAVRMRSP